MSHPSRVTGFAATCAGVCAGVYLTFFVASMWVADEPEPLLFVVALALGLLSYVMHVFAKAIRVVRIQREVIEAQRALINALIPSCDHPPELRHNHDAIGVYANCPACGTVLPKGES